ncbi:MAG: helix-turn-helix transcriptional regulator [Caulobacter sp.]|nr:helix-turn-helix transcriptional regulator [Caulobacter sp.]
MSDPSALTPGAGGVDPVPIFAALGDRTRLALLSRLADGEPRSIAALSSGGPLTRQAITKHLRVLEEAGLVASLRVGRESRFAARRETVDQARAYLDGVSAQWDDALARLKAHVED